MCLLVHLKAHTQTYLDIIPRESQPSCTSLYQPPNVQIYQIPFFFFFVRIFSKTKRIRRRKKKSIKWQLTRIYNSLYKDKTGLPPPLFRNGNFYGLVGSVVTIYGRVLRYPKKSRQPWFSLWAKEREREVWLATQRDKTEKRITDSCHTLQHGPVGRIGDGEDVRRHFVSLLALVQINDLLRVDGQPLVGVDYHAKQARVCLYF